MELQSLSNVSKTQVVSDVKPASVLTNPINNTKNEYVSSAASAAARAYALPAVSFEGKWDKMLNEIRSPKMSNKIKMSFDEAATFLEKLGFSSRGGKGSHCNFVKAGETPITIPHPHDGHNTVKPYTIDAIREYVTNHNITSI